MIKMYLPKNNLLLFITLLLICNNFVANALEIQQVLKDGINSVDGLNNPRQVKADVHSNRVFVTSGDDNSLLILELDGTLKPLKLFKNNEDKSRRLEGASSLITFNNGKSVGVVSFYDSALSLFETRNKNNFNFVQAFSDKVSYERIFKSTEPLTKEDNYGLFGAWDVAITSDEKQIYAASYKSNAISKFNVDENNNVSFDYKYVPTESGNLGSPTSIALSKFRNELITTGYEANTLTILTIEENGTLAHKQQIKDGVDSVEGLINPQKIIISPNEKYLYVACSGSNAVLVFESKNNQYSFVQSLTKSDINSIGLKGASSLALTSDGSRLFAAGEMDEGLILFDVLNNGQLKFNNFYQFDDNKIEGVTSIAVTNDNKSLLLTLGKRDALYLLKINANET